MQLNTVPETTERPAANATLWDVKACAKFLGKSPRWLWSAITRRPEEGGSIPHVRVGASPRFFPEDIAAWVRAGCPPAATFAECRAADDRRQRRANCN